MEIIGTKNIKSPNKMKIMGLKAMAIANIVKTPKKIELTDGSLDNLS